jgi:hypothetical protein
MEILPFSPGVTNDHAGCSLRGGIVALFLVVSFFLSFRGGNNLTKKKENGKSLSQSRWIGGWGYIRRGKWREDEKFVSGRGECVSVKR